MKRISQVDHKAYYDDPIALMAGEEFVYSGRGDAWDDNPKHIWLWAIAQDGREGWVPEGFALVKAGRTIAPHEYFARELNVVVNETLKIIREANGWAWCKNSKGQTGWIPLKVFDSST